MSFKCGCGEPLEYSFSKNEKGDELVFRGHCRYCITQYEYRITKDINPVEMYDKIEQKVKHKHELYVKIGRAFPEINEITKASIDISFLETESKEAYVRYGRAVSAREKTGFDD